MDEMNNVTMENETSMEVAPAESVVPAEAENPAYNNDCESSAGISFGTIVKVGAGAVLVGAAGEEGLQSHQGVDCQQEDEEKRSHRH